MRLAVTIAAWSADPDATLPPVAGTLGSSPALSLELQALGFSVVPLAANELPSALAKVFAGVERTDTLLLHIGGVLAADGSLARSVDEPLRLAALADVLADRPADRTLVVVEAAYRGGEDALLAVEHVEAVADALSSNAGSHTAVIAVHPWASAEGGKGGAKLGFTTALLGSAREVVQADGTATIEAAYGRARERQLDGAASGFAFLRGGAPFPIARGLPVSPVALPSSATTLPELGGVESVPSIVEEKPAVNVVPILVPAFARVDAPVVAETVADEPVIVHTSAATAGSSGAWLAAGDVEETSAIEALDAKIEAAVAAGDHRAMVALSRERLGHLLAPEARVDELFEIGRTLVAKLHDLPEAVATLEEARGIDATRTDVLEALRRAYSRLERWTETLEATLSLVKHTSDPRERAGLRVAASRFACERLDDEDYALELLTLALEDDPTHEAALAELVRIRRSRGDLVDLEQGLVTLAHRLVAVGDAARAWDVCQRLASLRRDDLGDAAGAVEALGIAKRLPLSELESRAVLAEQLLALDDDEGAVSELESIITVEPDHLRAHARLFSIHLAKGNRDRAYLAALALEELGDTTALAREILEAYRAEWGLRARAALDDAAWDLLRAPGSDEVVETVFRVSLRAALAAQLEDRGQRPPLDPARRQSETSTASIIRCFHWAARALGVPCPALYLLDEVPGGVAAVSAAEPTTALGPEVLRGLSAKTLAFLAGRHLTYFRPEYQVLVHFPTVEAAAGLFFAAVELVAPGTFVPPNLALRVAAAKNRLARHLRPEELMTLSAAVGRLEQRPAKVDFTAWIASVELTAGRAGLLLAGDLRTALTQARSEERGLSGLGFEDRRSDLLAFVASRTLADLRATYADTAPASQRPPTIDSAVVHKDDLSLRQPASVRGDRLQA